MGVAPPTLVEGVPRQGLPYGLFSALVPREGADVHWQNGVEWETLTCEGLSAFGDIDCDPGEIVGDFPKDLDPENAGNVIGDASPFTVYGTFVCAPVGFTPERAQERATARLQAREEAKVEREIWTGELGSTALTEGVDVLSLTAVDPLYGIALLEEWLGEVWGSQGLIHAGRAAAAVITKRARVTATGARLLTPLGTQVIAGSGYPRTATGTTDDGEAWMIASPPLFGYRSEVITSSNRAGDLLDRSDNTLTAIAERTWLAGWDPCGTAAVKINLEDGA